jgi:sRNA-binding protein
MVSDSRNIAAAREKHTKQQQQARKHSQAAPTKQPAPTDPAQHHQTSTDPPTNPTTSTHQTSTHLRFSWRAAM